MKLSTPSALILAALILAVALFVDGELSRSPRFAISSASGVLVRIDTRTGETSVCILGRDSSSAKLVAPCTGLRP